MNYSKQFVRRREQITFDALAARIYALKIEEDLYFKSPKDLYGWGVSKITRFGTDFFLLGNLTEGNVWALELPDDFATTDDIKETLRDRLRPEATDTPFFLLTRQEAETMGFDPAQAEPFPETEPRPRHKVYAEILDELRRGCKYLFVYRNRQEMNAALEGKIHAVRDTDGSHLCDIWHEDYLRFTDKLVLVDRCSAPAGITYFSDRVVNGTEARKEVLACRLVIVYLEETRSTAS